MSTAQNIIRAGRESAQDSAQLYRDVRENSVRYDDLHIQNMRQRANLKDAAWKADAQVAKAKISKDTDITLAKNAAKTNKKIADAKKSQRMAGKVAAAGSKLAAYHYLTNKKEEPNLYNEAYKQYVKKLEGRISDYKPGGKNAAEQELERQLARLNGLPPIEGSSAGQGTSSASTVVPKDGDLSMRYMQKLTSNGMSKEQAAATVGHLLVETGGFKHLEELAPNRYGTKGYGHLQWTDTEPGRGRRTDFMNYTKKHGLDHRTFEGNSDFFIHEITTNFNNSWTNGGSFEGLQQQGTLEEASGYLQNNFIRPGEPHTERRLAEGRNVLRQWEALQQQQ